MRYSLRYILDHRYDPNRSHERKLTERYIVLNVIGKALSPYPTYVFLNLGIRPDWVTFASLFFILGGAFLFVSGFALLGVVAILLFLLLDSVDGDMARVVGTTSYGAILDSFGADFFYSFIPVSIGYHLFSIETTVGLLEPGHILLAGALVSISFLLYRIINTKILTFFWEKQGRAGKSVFTTDTKGRPGLLVRMAKLYRNRVIRDNFFAEPGMIFLFSVLIFLEQYQLLALYLVIILVYNLGYLIPNFVRVYLSFLKYEPYK